MESPALIVGKTYRLVFSPESSDSNSAPDGPNDRTITEGPYTFAGLKGDWWGFVGGDGLSRIIVNPLTVSYVWFQVLPGEDPDDFFAPPTA